MVIGQTQMKVAKLCGDTSGRGVTRSCPPNREYSGEFKVPNEPDQTTWKYYVHYHDFNRRMDEWVRVAGRSVGSDIRGGVQLQRRRAARPGWVDGL